MKKNYVTVLISIMLFISICIIEFCIYTLSYNKNKKKSEELLRIAYDSVNNVNVDKGFTELPLNRFIKVPEELNSNNISNEDINNVNSKENILCENDIVGVLVIKKLKVEAPIRDGTSQEVMKTSVGHFIESDYWNGNVSFASHNNGTSAHYFEKINELSVNDEVEYITKLGTKVYKVQSISKVKDTDWSMVVKKEEQSEIQQNTVTLITCINGQPNYRLCVRGVEM